MNGWWTQYPGPGLPRSPHLAILRLSKTNITLFRIIKIICTDQISTSHYYNVYHNINPSSLLRCPCLGCTYLCCPCCRQSFFLLSPIPQEYQKQSNTDFLKGIQRAAHDKLTIMSHSAQSLLAEITQPQILTCLLQLAKQERTITLAEHELARLAKKAQKITYIKTFREDSLSIAIVKYRNRFCSDERDDEVYSLLRIP